MPSIQKETSVAAGAVADNLLTGSAFEYMRQPGVVSCAVVAAATGTFITIQSGPEIVLEESPPMVLTTMPIIPDHFYYNWGAAAGDRLLIRARNPTGGAVVHRAIANIQYTR
jgi:hypothetical protein